MKKRILIIEDTEFISDTIATALRFEGFETKIASNGEIGVAMALEYLPHLILCDVTMPVMDGFQVLEILRSEEQTKTIPFIFLTAKAEKSDIRRGMRLGAEDYLTKPFTTDELINAVHLQLAKKAETARHYDKKIEDLRGSITYALPHEFRTALNGIIGYSDLMETICHDASNDLVSASEILEFVSGIRESAHRLNRITENYLVYAQIQSVKADTKAVEEIRRNDRTTIDEILTETALRLAEEHNRKSDIKLKILHDVLIPISAINFSKIVKELIDNALKFSENGSSVVIATEVCDESLTISFRDYGRGLTQNELDSVGAYVQFHRKFFEQQGAGLGLAISKELCELYNGKIYVREVERDYVPQGTELVIVFPILKV